MGQVLVNFLAIGKDGRARQSQLINYRRESHLATDEGKLSGVVEHYYRYLAPQYTRDEASMAGLYTYLGLTSSGFVKAGDHELPKKGKRIFVFNHRLERFYEVFEDGPREILVTDKLLAGSNVTV
jgi:hypothetical protein